MPRLTLIISYDGTPFAGWQQQRGARTIQGELERAFVEICGEEISVVGAGRTDAGVHAFAQCAHADVPRATLSLERWASALNAHLPPTIRVLRVGRAAISFHARFSAVAKTYRYRIITAATLSPFEIDRAWHLRNPLNFEELKRVGKIFVGKHDFAAFAANRGAPVKETVRKIRTVRTIQRGDMIVIEVTGDGFLYKMVRLMVGAMVRCATGREAAENIRRQLREGILHGERLVAPASGLYLLRVRY